MVAAPTMGLSRCDHPDAAAEAWVIDTGRRLERQLAYHQELAELLDLDVDGTEERLLELRCVQEMAYRLGEPKEGRWPK